MCTDLASEVTQVFFLLYCGRIRGLGLKKEKEKKKERKQFAREGEKVAFHTNGWSWSNIYCPLGCPSERWMLISIFPPHTRSWHLSNDVPLPVGSSLSGLAVTLTAKRTFHSLGIASLSQTLLCNLQLQ